MRRVAAGESVCGFRSGRHHGHYNYSKTFAEQNPSFLSPLQMLLKMRQTMLANGDDLVKIWASEYGLPTSLNADQAAACQNQLKFISDFLTVWGDGLTDAQMAQLPAEYRELAASWKDWVGPAFIYSLRERLGQEMTEQGSFGLYYFDEASGEWKLKPAANGSETLSRTGSRAIWPRPWPRRCRSWFSGWRPRFRRLS